MKVFLRTDEPDSALAEELEAAASAMRASERAPKAYPRKMSAASLGDAQNDQEYLDTLLDLVWQRAEVNPTPTMPPHEGGFLRTTLARLRYLFWRVFRYPFDALTSQQNLINGQLAAAIEFMRAADREEIEKLRARVEELEARSGGKDAS